MPAYREDDPALLRLELETVPQGTPAAGVAKQLIALLTAGELTAGSRLPPERQLAEALGVGRSAVREALAALEILGIVTVRPGSGSYLRDGTSELLPTTLSWGLMLSSAHTAELLEVRSTLEIEAARLAAARISDDDIAKLESHVTAMGSTLNDLDAFIEADARFHLQIALSAENDVLRGLVQTVRSLLRLWVERALHDTSQAEAAFREHRAVYEAIAARDPQAAEVAMKAHMRTAANRIEHTLPDAN